MIKNIKVNDIRFPKRNNPSGRISINGIPTTDGVSLRKLRNLKNGDEITVVIQKMRNGERMIRKIK